MKMYLWFILPLQVIIMNMFYHFHLYNNQKNINLYINMVYYLLSYYETDKESIV